MLGSGTFGRVTLAQHKETKHVYALKAMQKHHVATSGQEKNIMNEKNLLLLCESPFVLALYATYQDADSIYMLLEFVPGGELFGYICELSCISNESSHRSRALTFACCRFTRVHR
jgi:serine/threonine protein kinase